MRKRAVNVVRLIDFPNVRALQKELTADRGEHFLTPEAINRTIMTRLYLRYPSQEEAIASMQGFCYTDLYRIPGFSTNEKVRMSNWIRAWRLAGYQIIICERDGNDTDGGGGDRTSETVDASFSQAIYSAIASAEDPQNLHLVLVLGDKDYASAVLAAIQIGVRVSIFLTSDTSDYKDMHAAGKLEDLIPLFQQGMVEAAAPRMKMRFGKLEQIYVLDPEREAELLLANIVRYRCNSCREVFYGHQFMSHRCNPLYRLHEQNDPTEQNVRTRQTYIQQCDAADFCRYVAENIRRGVIPEFIRRVMEGVECFNEQVVGAARILMYLHDDADWVTTEDLSRVIKDVSARIDVMRQTELIMCQQKSRCRLPRDVHAAIPVYLEEIRRRTATENTSRMLGMQGLASARILQRKLTTIFDASSGAINAIRQQALVQFARVQSEEISIADLPNHILFYLLVAADISEMRDLMLAKDGPVLLTRVIDFKEHVRTLPKPDSSGTIEVIKYPSDEMWTITERILFDILRSVAALGEDEQLLDGIETIARQCSDIHDIDGTAMLTVLAGCGLLTIEEKGGEYFLRRPALTHPALIPFQPVIGAEDAA